VDGNRRDGADGEEAGGGGGARLAAPRDGREEARQQVDGDPAGRRAKQGQRDRQKREVVPHRHREDADEDDLEHQDRHRQQRRAEQHRERRRRAGRPVTPFLTPPPAARHARSLPSTVSTLRPPAGPAAILAALAPVG
jgi:hypothetical protein